MAEDMGGLEEQGQRDLARKSKYSGKVEKHFMVARNTAKLAHETKLF